MVDTKNNANNRSRIWVIIIAPFILLLFLFMSNFVFNSNDSKKEAAYDSYVSVVEKVATTLGYALEATEDEKSIRMFDAYTYMLLAGQRLNILFENAKELDKATTLKNDWELFILRYQVQVSGQLSHLDVFNVERHRSIKTQLEQYIEQLPAHYEGSKAFKKQFTKAAELIIPFAN